MRVKLIAHTKVVDDAFPMDRQETSTDAEHLITGAGRLCYLSFNRPNPKTHDDRDYIQRTLIEQSHWSIAEHASASFLIEGVSRSLTHEIIRHRHLSFSELSQRFVNVEDAEVVYPPAVRGDAVLETNMDYAFRAARQAYEGNNNLLTTAGFPRKQAREAARAVMPNATETKIVVTGNHRSWRDAIGKRWHVAADREICELFGEILRQLREIAPAVYADIPESPYGSDA